MQSESSSSKICICIYLRDILFDGDLQIILTRLNAKEVLLRKLHKLQNKTCLLGPLGPNTYWVHRKLENFIKASSVSP